MKPEPQYGHVICPHDDPQRTHFWFEGLGPCWIKSVEKSSPNLTYQKPIQLPDGFELVPEGEIVGKEDWLWSNTLKWIGPDKHNWAGDKAVGRVSDSQLCFARRKPAKTEERQWIPLSERLPECGQTMAAIGQPGATTGFVVIAGRDFGKSDYTHWMPMPEVPRKSPAEKAWDKHSQEFTYLARTDDKLKEAFTFAFEKGEGK